MINYYNSLSESEKKIQLSKCRFMSLDEFNHGNKIFENKKIVIVGCGAQGLNQGLNMRDSGLNVSFALRLSAAFILTPTPVHPKNWFKDFDV